MLDIGLLLSLAEIAGEFVGFGALIAVRSGGPREPYEVVPVRAVLLTGMATVIAALAPVTISRYELSDHDTLLLSGLVVLVTYVGFYYVHRRSPQYKAAEAVLVGTQTRTPAATVEDTVSMPFIGLPPLGLVIIALGVAPALEAALYFTVVVLFLVVAGWTLLWLAFTDPRVASGRGAHAASGSTDARTDAGDEPGGRDGYWLSGSPGCSAKRDLHHRAGRDSDAVSATRGIRARQTGVPCRL
jgi:hypothetical protein